MKAALRSAASSLGLPAAFACRPLRDLLVADVPGGVLVVATDSAGGIGPNPADMVEAPARVVGLFTARVALMEVLAAGADPVALALTVGNAPDIAEEVRRGALQTMAAVRLGEAALVVSTEKNVPTVQTAVGATALGWARRRQDLLPGGARAGDLVLAVGRPKVGAEVSEADPTIADPSTVVACRRLPCVHDILPVGSRGLRAEAVDLAASAGLRLELRPAPEAPEGLALDLQKSAGPATVVLVAVAPSDVPQVRSAVGDKPVSVVGIAR